MPDLEIPPASEAGQRQLVDPRTRRISNIDSELDLPSRTIPDERRHASQLKNGFAQAARRRDSKQIESLKKVRLPPAIRPNQNIHRPRPPRNRLQRPESFDLKF